MSRAILWLKDNDIHHLNLWIKIVTALQVLIFGTLVKLAVT